MTQRGFLYFYGPAPGQASEGGTLPQDIETELIVRVAPGGVSSKRALCRAGALGESAPAEDTWGVLARRSEQETLELQLDPTRQTWRIWKRFLDGDTPRGTLWVGYWLDRRPGPQDLVRDRLWPTVESSRLGDGNDWLLPVLHFFVGDWKGPREWTFTEEGKWESRMESRYAPLAARGERLFQTLMSVPDAVWETLDADARAWRPKQSELTSPFLKVEAAALLSDALGLNYCISGPEVALLGLLTDQTLETSCMSLLGDRTLERFIREFEGKKKAEAAGDAGSGSYGDGV